MRLIDADAFIEDIKTEIVNLAMDGMKGTPRSREELYQIIERIGEQPTAYNVEAVVAELEKLKEEYEHHCIHGAWQRGAIDGAKIVLSKAISIVRGKERKYCGNCKHQPEPLTTCEWLKSQTQIIKECPRWEGKE